MKNTRVCGSVRLVFQRVLVSFFPPKGGAVLAIISVFPFLEVLILVCFIMKIYCSLCKIEMATCMLEFALNIRTLGKEHR